MSVSERPPGFVRRIAQSLLESTSGAVSEVMSDDDLAADAVILAPHPDDETLGCGGTVLRKRALGARVAIVFMTDGAASHQNRMAREQLVAERQREALEAAAVLGVESDAVHFIGVPDTQLRLHEEESLPRIVELLEHYRPGQVYAPFHRDGLADHVATAAIAERAALAAGIPDLLGFPVWFWNHWPWMRPVPGMIDPPAKRFKKSVKGARALLTELRLHVDVSEQRPAKAAALASHRSQMQGLASDPAWPTLADVAGGDFLARLLGDREIFARRTLNRS